MWQARGKDASGSDTWVTTTVGQTFLITRHPARGVDLWRLPQKELVSIGFKSVEAAKAYVGRMVDEPSN